MKTWEVPGLALAVVKDGEIVLVRGYGVGEIGGDRQVNADTVFTIASCTKAFTAAAVGLLVEEGKLRWDDPVVEHLRDFELADRYLTEHVTLRDLLCHRTGLRRADLLGDGAGFDAEEVLRASSTWSRWRSSAPGSSTTITCIPRWMSWWQASRGTLGSDSSPSACSGRSTWNRRRRPGRRPGRSAGDAPLAERCGDRRPPGARATEGIYSTVGDMARWLGLQLGEGAYADRRLLKPETVREMHALQFSVPVRSRPAENVYAARFLRQRARLVRPGLPRPQGRARTAAPGGRWWG